MSSSLIRMAEFALVVHEVFFVADAFPVWIRVLITRLFVAGHRTWDDLVVFDLLHVRAVHE